MKIGILTLYHNNYNYGGQLQAYALQRYLYNRGNEVELIDYNQYPENKIDVWLDRIFRNYKVLLHPVRIKQLRENSICELEDRKRYKELLKNNTLGIETAVEKFDKFLNKEAHTNCFNRHSIRNLSDYYDVVVLGGDQIWNPDHFSKAYFGNWVNDEKKIVSYSASAGKDNFQSYELRRMKKLLARISNISVREDNFQCILKEQLKRGDIQSVLDPVFLLTENEWKTIAVEPDIKEKYIFAYLLNKDANSRKEITLYAQQHNMKIVTIPHARGSYNSCDEGFGDIVRYDVGPLEFLGLIKDAEIVFTDSFHGTCFSIIFQKEFQVISNSVDNANKTTNARMKTILSKTGLMQRMTDSQNIGNCISELDYKEVEHKLKEHKERSQEWLLNVLRKVCSAQ